MSADVTPGKLAEGLRDAFLRYYDTAYWLNDPGLMAERRALLEAKDAIVGDVLLEPVLPYPSIVPLGQAADDAGIARGVLDAVARAAFGVADASEVKLRAHQANALRLHFSDAPQHNVVVTSGTGSGKTESFLFPILARLLEESRDWAAQPAANHWWSAAQPEWVPMRHGERRPGAVRSLILYPTNALVEDQMTRLRRAIRALNEEQPERPLWFGRYTGSTLGNQRKPTKKSKKAAEVAKELRDLAHDYATVLNAAQTQGDAPAGGAKLEPAEFSDPATGEMMTRWDMIDSPPDVLVTNYSMLNTMMMRAFEEPIFAATQEWIKADPSHVFTLVVDELHLYRGTQGSEVALIIRQLLSRLGLEADSPQLRIIATSASLDEGESSLSYLEEFFGTARGTFAIDPGQPLEVPQEPGTWTAERAAQASAASLSHAIAAACREPGSGRIRATRTAEIAERLLGMGDRSVPVFEALLDRLAAGAPAEGGDQLIPMRAHLFVRAPRGMWACSNAACSGLKNSGPDRQVGTLYPAPRAVCDHCGCRVLELLYCFHCGDTSLGGNVVERRGDATMVSSLPTTERQAERPVFRKTVQEYVWFRPGGTTAVEDWTAGKTKFGFRPLSWDATLGLASPSVAPTSALRVVPLGAGSSGRSPALPTKCPSCGVSERQDSAEAFQTGVVRSPIRAHTAGSAAATQLYLSELVRVLASGKEGREAVVDPKTIIFTDSRDDAARTAAGVALNHHRDLVRQVVRREVHRAPDPFAVLDAITDPDDAESHGVLAGWQANMMRKAKVPLTPEMQAALDDALDRLGGVRSISLLQLFARVQDAMLEIGVNPGGPSPWNATLEDTYSVSKTPWYRAFRPPFTGAWPTMPVEHGREKILREMRRSVAESMFDRARRDMESVGIARLTILDVEPVAGPFDKSDLFEVMDSVIRILGTRRRYDDSYAPGVQGEPVIVAPVRAYIEAVAQAHGVDADAAVAQVDELFATAHVKRAVKEWILTTGSVDTNLAAVPASRDVWRCKVCRYVHLHPSAGVCANTQCHAAALTLEPARDDDADYYAWLAGMPPRRLAIAELTGQTRPLALQRDRQRRFKGALAPSEYLLTDELDALSVTTTMEVGVDIGSLRSTMMANVPPQRFNYQQRVGRAGRSGQALSFALTLCRDRTHDDYYFQRPERITGDIPPQPFLDLGRRTIVQRGVNSECLRLAFGSLSDPPEWGPESSHGTFGAVEDWTGHRDAIAEFLVESEDVVLIAERAVRYTRLGADEVERIVEFVRASLIGAIDDVIEREGAGAEGELSALLARRGLLPMFGFPTRVRALYDGMPWNTDALQRMVVSDRPLGQAISTFAPGAEVVKDGKVHTAVGFVDFTVKGSVVKPVANPLGPATSIGKCDTCGRTELQAKPRAVVCAQCGGKLRALDLHEPRGFRTSYKPRSYDDRNDDQSYASSPEISVQATPDRRDELGPIDLEVYEQAPLVSVNENSGFGYVFETADDGSVTVSPGNPHADVKSVIGEIRVTDALLVTPRRVALKTGSVGLLEQWSAPAAYTSVAEALKLASQAHLDLDPGELAVGLNPVRVPVLAEDEPDMKAQVAAAIYLADTAENGAGYAIEIGDPSNFKRVLAHALGDLQDRWADPAHAAKCDVSCPDCMRSYDNSRKHPLLDWRLALDMLELFSGRELTLGRSLLAGNEVYEVAARALPGAEARSYGEVPAIVSGRKCVLLAHPLWRVEEAWLDDAQAVAQVQAQAMDGLDVQWFDARRFRLNPVSVMPLLQS
ncbi:DEAD/DEAH box helicase [Demequina gelatinilytica]|uniref:DEAD/DEAH box helicase n=1 Tax=Demequina gelatinilytica TaxID=1638980 RepID=UPI00078362DD|nr:DEAD/DEAH box helicase [Demequina gelatinilytica]